MSIYKNKPNYRKIWESHNGPIPKDKDGRSYEIHHIDGNRENNSLSNLVCVSIQEHYEIHQSQGDWGACSCILARMKTSSEELSKLTSLHNALMVANGTHPFLRRDDGTSVASDQKKDANYVHNWAKRSDGTSVTQDKVVNGTHPFLRRNDGTSAGLDNNLKRILSGDHNFLKRSDGTSQSSDRVENGTHNWIGPDSNINQIANGTHASQIKVTCLFCKKTMDKANYSKYHGERCKNSTC